MPRAEAAESPGMAGTLYEATMGRAFAAIYDTMLSASEEAGLAAMRHELLGQAAGTVIELGAGSGLNLGHYRGSVERLILTEPSAHMAKRLRERADASPRPTEVIAAGAEHLPLPDASADTVVTTLVLCTVDDPYATLEEVTRVLKPGGRLLFLEHVRADDPGTARWQDRLEAPWHFVGAGCHCNRDTLATLRASPLEIDHVEHDRFPKAIALVKPLIRGTAVRAA
jgi:ubiquinone/menaquinone biosynthesis C-methylase UbiE